MSQAPRTATLEINESRAAIYSEALDCLIRQKLGLAAFLPEPHDAIMAMIMVGAQPPAPPQDDATADKGEDKADVAGEATGEDVPAAIADAARATVEKQAKDAKQIGGDKAEA